MNEKERGVFSTTNLTKLIAEYFYAVILYDYEKRKVLIPDELLEQYASGESAGFRNVFYPKKKGEFRMDITQCPYKTYLTEQGCPELTRLFCDNDVYSYGNLPNLSFTRTKTLGSGGDLCDFHLSVQK